MTTINATYILIDKPYVAAGVRARAIQQGRDITEAQVIAEQTAAIIEREVGRLLQLALAAGQIPGVTPANGSVYALAEAGGSTAEEVADAVRIELATELARVDVAVSSRLATAGYTAPENADVPTAVENAAAILLAAQAAPIHSNVKLQNSAPVIGTGITTDKWRGVQP